MRCSKLALTTQTCRQLPACDASPQDPWKRGAGRRNRIALPQRLSPTDTPRLSLVSLPKLQSGAAEYLSVSVFENSTPQDLLDFFNDDGHRLHWDDMFVGFEVLECDSRTGAEVTRWVRRFPLMCCPRDYVFARRSFVDGCVCCLLRAHTACADDVISLREERTFTQFQEHASIATARPAAGVAA